MADLVTAVVGEPQGLEVASTPANVDVPATVQNAVAIGAAAVQGNVGGLLKAAGEFVNKNT
jgi:hypothetical protein